MKAKVKLELIDSECYMGLDIKLKLENEWFYWHKKTVVKETIFKDGEFIGYKDRNYFFTDVVNYLSDINNVIKDGEELMRDIIESRAKELKANSKEKEALELLKKLKQPIQIEIK